ncbi:MAG: tRNA lysidine(34) synthetase TilS [Flammeovirgaceae bacterium]|nr:tRNA lysidine(34) synthetase TilS [Flammeovirgaceae bacterium]
MSGASYKSIPVNCTFVAVLEQFLRHIEQTHLCSKEDKILLAVSGGLDSMVMLELFKQAGYSISVAHCNFQLRGEESDADEKFVKDVCSGSEIPFHARRFETEKYASENRLSIQMAARELRYAWFHEVMEFHEYNKLATAHHVNDSIETVLMNWIHGDSLEGFTGIPANNDKIIRPLLFATRNEIESYAKENKLKWREDSSNQADNYQRNFLRHQVIPKLKELNPSFESTFQRGLRKIQSELSFLEKAFVEWKLQFVKMAGETMSIEKKAFEGLRPSASIIHRLLVEYGFSFDVCEEIGKAMYGQSGKKFLSPSHELIIDRTQLIVTPHQDFWKETLIKAGQDQSFLGPWSMDIEKSESLVPLTDSDVALLDADKLKFPLRWRIWKEGDYFYPLGMDHKKKISDFLIDMKVSLADKKFVTVLESEGQIAWVVGYRLDNRFKITRETVRGLTFSIRPYFV